MKKLMMAVVVVVMAAGASGGMVRADEAPATDFFGVAEAMKASFVQVEYTVQYDKGEEPESAAWQFSNRNLAWAVEQERPVEEPGFVLSDRQIVTQDMIVNPRFIKKIMVSFGDQKVEAKIVGTARSQSVVFLETAEPLKGVKPLAFDAARKGPYLSIRYFRTNTIWKIGVKDLSSETELSATGQKKLTAPSFVLIADQAGVPVGLTTSYYLPADDSWKGSPAKWPVYSAEEMAKMLAGFEQACNGSVVRVDLSFRSPKKQGQQSMYRDDEQSGATEQNVLGVLTDERTVLVLANLEAKVTARLQRITVHPPAGDQAFVAKFDKTLKDYGCFTAKLEKSMSGAARLSTRDVRDYAGALLMSADVRLQGERRTSYYDHLRINDFDFKWQYKIYPIVPLGGKAIFVAATEGELVVLPVVHRSKVTQEQRYRNEGPASTPAAYLAEALADLDKNSDPNNIPLTDEQENRMAWLGIEMQPLGRELARANKVSELTMDGQTGGMISYVYPDSPAAKAGIEAGYILLRIYAPDQPKPLEVHVEESQFGTRSFPWEQLDRLPEEYYDKIPSPWPPADNGFNQMLTKLGFGKKFEAEFFHNDATVRKSFEVVESPPYYEAAAHYKATALGITVRNLTYEVRRYFQKQNDEPGVIVSRIEPGSKASVAGIKPFEVITHVNEQPVNNIADFERLIAKQDELRLSVKRPTTGRVVKVKMDEKQGGEAAKESAGEGVKETGGPAASAAKAEAGTKAEK